MQQQNCFWIYSAHFDYYVILIIRTMSVCLMIFLTSFSGLKLNTNMKLLRIHFSAAKTEKKTVLCEEIIIKIFPRLVPSKTHKETSAQFHTRHVEHTFEVSEQLKQTLSIISHILWELNQAEEETQMRKNTTERLSDETKAFILLLQLRENSLDSSITHTNPWLL